LTLRTRGKDHKREKGKRVLQEEERNNTGDPNDDALH
jgi:hypothetical protein